MKRVFVTRNVPFPFDRYTVEHKRDPTVLEGLVEGKDQRGQNIQHLEVESTLMMVRRKKKFGNKTKILDSLPDLP